MFPFLVTLLLLVQPFQPDPSKSLRAKEEALKKQFAAKQLSWPAKQMYIRSFKYDSQLEVWVKNDNNGPFQHFKTYKICTLSGSLGPKRIDGDYQVPEGFYYISEFKPKSEFHMALGLNYPNASDVLLSDSLSPGGGIFIHGSCVTTGCIPIQNEQIEELYILAASVNKQGQDFIPVHIFPIRYHEIKSEAYLTRTRKEDLEYMGFSAKLQEVFDYFEEKKLLPIISVNKKGEYVLY